MQYINQLELKHIPYETNMAHGGNPPERRTVASSGCGLCSTCMAVELLTDKTLSIEESVQLSYDTGANHLPGTDLDLLGPVVAEKFGISYRGTASLDEAIAHLQCGGAVVARMGKSLFTDRSHYILLLSYADGEFCILDPSYKPGKFDRPDRVGKVNDTRAPYLYCNAELLHSETEREFTKYHLFGRIK